MLPPEPSRRCASACLKTCALRKLEPKTQDADVRAVRKLAEFLQQRPDTASVEDLRRFQLHMVGAGTSAISVHATLTGLSFFFDPTLGRADLLEKVPPVRTPRTLPVVLGREEVTAPLRVSEVIRLRVAEIDSQRVTLRVGTGQRPQGQLRDAAAAADGTNPCKKGAFVREREAIVRLLTLLAPGFFLHPTSPVTGMAAPWIALAASLARNAMTSASAGGATQREGSASGMAARFSGVSMIEGSTQFTLMPLSLSSPDIASVSRISALFEAQ